MQSLIVQLNQFRAKGELCNVILHVGEETFPCHRLILQAASKYFYDLFKDHPCHTTDNVKLQQLSSNGFKETLDYIYGADIKITEEIVKDVAITSDYLKLNLLFDRCVDLLRDGSCPSAVVQLYNFGNVKNDSQLLGVTKELIWSQFSNVSQTNDFLSLTLEQIKLLLDGVPKKMIVTADPIYKWIEYDQTERDAHLKELLEIVHLIGPQVNGVESKEDLDCIPEENIKFQLTNVLKRYCTQSSECAKAEVFSLNKQIKELTIFANSIDSEEEEDEEENVVTVNYLRNGNIIESEKNLNIMCNSFRAVKLGKMYFVLFGVEKHIKFKKIDIETGNTCDLTPPPTFSTEYVLTTNGTDVFLYLSGGRLTFYNLYSGNNNFRFLKYDMNVNLWSNLPKPEGVDVAHTCVVSSSNGIYRIGGDQTEEVRFLDIRTSNWVSLPSMLTKRYDPSGCLYDNKLYISGGYESRTVEIYDIMSHNKWMKSNPMPTERYSHKMMCVDGILYVFGGKGRSGVKQDNFLSACVTDIDRTLLFPDKYNLPDSVWTVSHHKTKEVVDVVHTI